MLQSFFFILFEILLEKEFLGLKHILIQNSFYMYLEVVFQIILP